MKTVLCIILLALITFSCQKELSQESIVATLPTLTTTAATSITNTTATSGGNITDNGGAAITARGVCWGTSPNPVVAGNHTTDGTGTGVFASNITGLTAMTVYYVRAYATNSEGTAYGNEISFTTTNTSTALPTVTTTSLSSITMTTASGGGDVVADGGATVTARGVCWSTTANPTIALSTKTTDGSGTGIFTSAIAGLTANTTYHVRAYATNSVGTSYGGDSVFTTASAPTIPAITTTALSAITNTTASSGGTISTDGGAPVTARGVCWSTTANPTIALSTKTTDGTGIGIFTSNITALTANTTYHVRAYATNSVGTAYGNDLSFTTTGSTTQDVYVAGYEYNGTYKVAKVWKSGVATSLTNGVDGNGYGESVFVSGTDVYVAGIEDIGGSIINSIAKSWKNGVLTSLTGGTGHAEAQSVYVSGADVYVAGSEQSGSDFIATIWKNGVASPLPAGGNAVAHSVYISGTDVYAAGSVVSAPAKAMIWKNGTGTPLSVLSFETKGQSVYVSGGDEYVAGYHINGANTIATIWKNGVAATLSSSTPKSRAWSVFVSSTDVYVAGNQEDASGNLIATIWKNGVAIALTSSSGEADANSVFVLGTDVYAAGYINNGIKDIATVWKNGVATSLTNGTQHAVANSVFVK